MRSFHKRKHRIRPHLCLDDGVKNSFKYNENIAHIKITIKYSQTV